MITNSLGLQPSQCSNLSSRFLPMNNGHLSHPCRIDQSLLETFSFLLLQSMTLHASAGAVGSLSLSGHITRGRSWHVPAALVFIALLTLIPSTAAWVPTGLQTQMLHDRSSQSSPSFIPKHSLEVLRRGKGAAKDYSVSNI